MPSKISAGLLMYRIKNSELQVFLIHPGGPFWKNKDEGVWSIPKGELENNNMSLDSLLNTAKREFKEETGINTPEEKERFIYLGEIKQKSGKIVHAWTFEGNWNGLLLCQSFVAIEWPYKSGKMIKVPEVDNASFFSIEKAKKKINTAQIGFIDRLERVLEK